eukprot:5135820-Alexandrium_andersonii.AAC.1
MRPHGFTIDGAIVGRLLVAPSPSGWAFAPAFLRLCQPAAAPNTHAAPTGSQDAASLCAGSAFRVGS